MNDKTVLTRDDIERIASSVYMKERFTKDDEVWHNLHWLTAFAHQVEAHLASRIQPAASEADPTIRNPLMVASEAGAVPVTDAMAYAFHNAIADGSLGSDDIEEIKKGLRAALAGYAAPPSAPAAESAEPEWIDDPHDIEQGMMRNPKYVAATAPTADAQGDERAEHSDDIAVDRFAAAMKEKLAQARKKGRRGWREASPSTLSRMLREHVEKGDARDVANFCMFLWTLGHPINGQLDNPLVHSAIAVLSRQPSAPASADEVADAFDCFRAALRHCSTQDATDHVVGVLESRILAALAAAKPVVRDSLIAEPAELSPEDLELFAATYQHFTAGVDTATDMADLIRFAALGLLECMWFTVTDKGEAAYAARAQRAAEGNGDV